MNLDDIQRPNLSGIPSDFIPVRPNAAFDNTGKNCIGLYCGTAGNVRAVLKGGAVRDIPVPAQTPLPGLFMRVYAVGTTATGILALQG